LRSIGEGLFILDYPITSPWHGKDTITAKPCITYAVAILTMYPGTVAIHSNNREKAGNSPGLYHFNISAASSHIRNEIQNRLLRCAADFDLFRVPLRGLPLPVGIVESVKPLPRPQ